MGKSEAPPLSVRALLPRALPRIYQLQCTFARKAEFALVAFTELSTRTDVHTGPTQQGIPEGGDGRPERRRLGRERKSRYARDEGEQNKKLHR